jgi:hypothetical protein
MDAVLYQQLKKDAAHTSDNGHTFVDTDALRSLIDAYDASTNQMQWRSIDDNPPKDRPILAWCDHEADPYVEPNDPKNRLTLYAGHAEGLSHAPTGWHIIEWGGAWDDRTYEYDGGCMPDWWFVVGSEFEQAANPLFWMPLPPQPVYERKILNQEREYDEQ